MPIYSPTGYLDITNATLRTSNIETSNIKIGSANLFITTGNVSDEVFQFTNATTGLVTTGNVEIGGSITAPDGVTDIKSNLIVEGNVEAAALRLNSVSISPVYTIASGSGTIDFQGAPTSLTASANIEVTGNVIAHQFHGDGSGLTGIPPTAITGTLSQWTNVTVDEVYFQGNVGISNTDPGHDLSIGSNLFVDDDGSNVLVVDGNVSATYFEGDGSKLTGLVTTLESVANIGNSTTNVIQFTNETTGFVTDANAVIGSNLTISGLTAQKVPYVDAQKVLRDSYITTSTGLTSIDSNLSVTGNMFVYGERFFIESESQLLKDPIIGLAKDNNVNEQLDIGILMQRPTSNVGIIHHGGTNELTLGYTTSNLTATEIINDLSQELTVNVIGNVVTQNNLSVGGSLKINTISAASSHSLAAVSNMGNTTSNVIQFTNPTTSLVASGNVEVDGNVVAGYLYGDGSNISGISSNLDQIVNIGNVTSNTVQFTNATTGLVTTANVEVGGDLTVSGVVGSSETGALTLPSGTTAQQPTGVAGMIRFNETVGKMEFYNGTVWLSIAGISATGGTITNADGYKIHTFTSSGTFTMITGGDVEYLIVAGGGGGGSVHAGGGGAGGVLFGTISKSPGSYTVTVGNGGAGHSGSPSANGTNGSPSKITNWLSGAATISADGGGGGGSGYHASATSVLSRAGSAGGSGGGGGPYHGGGSGTSGQGSDGGSGGNDTVAGHGGGGGGAGGVGGNSVGPHTSNGGISGAGGTGHTSSITGTSIIYAGGGSGGRWTGNNTSPGEVQSVGVVEGGGGLGGARTLPNTTDVEGYLAQNAEANTGGGGGGGGDSAGPGGNGGSGIVILRYLL